MFEYNWNKENYQKFLDYLDVNKDLKYREFHYRLLKDNRINFIGVRAPILKDIAKQVSKTNYIEFIKLNTLKTYEEKTIYGLLLGYLKIDFNIILNLTNNYLVNIDNWATCDLTCANLKIFKKNKEIGFNYLKNKVNSNNIWIQRFVIVTFLDYFLCDEYIDEVLKTISSINTNEYYVEMAMAWLLATAYINYQDKVLSLLKSSKISKNVTNLTIKKANESYRITKEKKKLIKNLKNI